MRMWIGNDDGKTTAQIVGDRIQAELKHLGMTKEEFKQKTGLNERTMRSYFSGEHKMDIERFKQIAKLLNASYEYLLGDSSFSNSAQVSIVSLLYKMGFEVYGDIDPEDPDAIIVEYDGLNIQTTCTELQNNIMDILRYKIRDLNNDQKEGRE